MLASLVIAGLFAWGYFAGTGELNQRLVVPMLPGIAAFATFTIVLISYFAIPLPRLMASAVINYALFLASITYVVIDTGGLGSVFIGLWVATLAFAGFFGLGGVVVGTAAFATFIVHQYLVPGLAPSSIMLAVVLGAVPLVASFMLWGRSIAESNQETKEDKSYHELAGELSKVSGKSEVVINAIGEGVLAIDGQGIIELINPAAEQLLGWPRHDALTLSYKSILKIKDTKNQVITDANNPIAQVIATNKPVKNDSFSLETQSGKAFMASITVNPVGQLGQGVIVVFRDITTEKSDERQRAEFISTASHEMRTPVASIEGYLGLALNPATATIDEKARDFITKAHESAQHLGRLFADLLDVSKADDSRLKNDPKIVDVVPFIHDIVQGLTPKAIEKGLRVLYKPMPDGIGASSANERDPARRLNPVFYANVDNDHLREVVQNLVENAIKYTLKGEVIIDVAGDESHVTISIADTGIGIPREDQTHLFQKFYRVDNSDTREIGGTGLGLYLCRRLAETMGGRIWVESEYKRGSTFFVEIPRTDHDEAQRLIEQASVEAERQAERERQQSIRESEAQQAAALEAIAAPGAKITPVQPVAPEAPQIVPLVDTVLPQPTVALPTPAAPSIPEPPMPSAPLPQEPVAPAPQFAPPSTTANTPLSAIEANPSQYVTRQVGGVTIPPRR